jgi:tripartite-type tricarboxylate transporter receptor subunit TctC
MNPSKKFSLALAGLLSLSLVQAASAQTYPSKPIRIIVPFAAGGANDLSARAIQQPLARILGGTVIVENVPGASTKIATEQIVKAAPDGHTLMLAGHLALMGYFYSGAVEEKYWHKMTILGQTGQFPWGMLEARADAPFKSWQELVAHAKKNPGKLNVGGPAPGGMMNMIVLETAKAAGINVTYVPYKGGGPSGMALLGGQVDYRVAQPSEVYPNVKAGKTRALAVAGPQRMEEMPDVPTLRELGIAFDVPPFGFDFWGPPNLPPALAQRITHAVEQAVKDPAFIEASRVLVYKPVFTGPDKLQESIRNFEANIGPKMMEMFPPEPKK